MRQILLVAVLIVTGCQSVEGPRQRQFDGQPVDAPWLSIEQQQQRGRDQLAIPTPDLAPKTFSEFPGPHQR